MSLSFSGLPLVPSKDRQDLGIPKNLDMAESSTFPRAGQLCSKDHGGCGPDRNTQGFIAPIGEGLGSRSPTAYNRYRPGREKKQQIECRSQEPRDITSKDPDFASTMGYCRSHHAYSTPR